MIPVIIGLAAVGIGAYHLYNALRSPHEEFPITRGLNQSMAGKPRHIQEEILSEAVWKWYKQLTPEHKERLFEKRVNEAKTVVISVDSHIEDTLRLTPVIDQRNWVILWESKKESVKHSIQQSFNNVILNQVSTRGWERKHFEEECAPYRHRARLILEDRFTEYENRIGLDPSLLDDDHFVRVVPVEIYDLPSEWLNHLSSPQWQHDLIPEIREKYSNYSKVVSSLPDYSYSRTVFRKRVDEAICQQLRIDPSMLDDEHFVRVVPVEIYDLSSEWLDHLGSLLRQREIVPEIRENYSNYNKVLNSTSLTSDSREIFRKRADEAICQQLGIDPSMLNDDHFAGIMPIELYDFPLEWLAHLESPQWQYHIVQKIRDEFSNYNEVLNSTSLTAKSKRVFRRRVDETICHRLEISETVLNRTPEIDYSLARKDTKAFVESVVIRVRKSNTSGVSFNQFRHEYTNYDNILGAFKDEGEPYIILKERVRKLWLMGRADLNR